MHSKFDVTISDERLVRVDLGLKGLEPSLDDVVAIIDKGGNIARIQASILVTCIDALCNRFNTNPNDLIKTLKGVENVSNKEQASSMQTTPEASSS